MVFVVSLDVSVFLSVFLSDLLGLELLVLSLDVLESSLVVASSLLASSLLASSLEVVSEELPLSVLVEASSSFLGVLTVTLSAGFSALVSSFLTTVVLKFWTVLPLVSSILQL